MTHPSYSNLSTTVDNRNWSDVDSYLEARVDALKAEVARLKAELERKDAVIRCREWMLEEDSALIRSLFDELKALREGRR